MTYSYDINRQPGQRPKILVPIGEAGFFLSDSTRWKKVVGKIHGGEAFALILTSEDEVIRTRFPFALPGDYLITFLPGPAYALSPTEFGENWEIRDE